MKCKMPIIMQLLLLFVWMPLFAQTHYSQISSNDLGKKIPEKEKALIEKALPDPSVPASESTKKLLVCTLNVRDGKPGKGHPSIPFANYAIQRMGEKTGAYLTYFSNDTLVFQKEILKQFDAVCFNNTAGVLFTDPQLRKDLLDYVFEGGGFVGIHAAGATFCQWPVYDQFPEYGEMLGGYEAGGHPWKPHEWITLRVDEPEHPVNASFKSKSFEISDEVFQFQTPYSRDRCRVLLSIDTSKTDMSLERRVLPERREDGDLAISWVKSYGRGRVFYTSLGHNNHINWNPEVLGHYLNGIRFAMRAIDGPVTPSGKLSESARVQEALGWKLAVQAWTFNRFTFLEALKNASRLGLQYIEAYPGQMLSPDLPDSRFIHSMPDSECRMVREKCLALGIRIINYGVVDLPNDEAACREVFQFAQKMGIETIVSEPTEETLPLIDTLCEEYNIRVAIHNHPNPSHYWNPLTVLNAVQSAGPRIGSCCDTGHWMRSGIRPLDGLKQLEGHIVSLHLKDLNAFGRQKAHDVIWGRGKGNLDGVLLELKKQNFKGVITIEYEYNWDHSTEDVRNCRKTFQDKIIALEKDN